MVDKIQRWIKDGCNGFQIMLIIFTTFLLGCRLYPKIEGYIEHQKEAAALQSQWLVTDTYQMHYWEGGNPNGETLLFLHGFGGDALWAWARNLPAFAQDYHIIAPDLLWFGQSTGGAPSLQMQRDAILAVLEQENISKTHVVGLSYGGFVALQLQQQDTVEKMVLVGVGGASFELDDIQNLQNRFAVQKVTDIFVPQQEDDVRLLLDICFHAPTFLVPHNLSADLYQNVFGKYPVEQSQLLEELLQNVDEYAGLFHQTSSHPQSLLVIGRSDPIFSVEQATELQDALKGELLVYSFADHVPNVGFHRRFNKDVRQFLQTADQQDPIEGQ